MFPRNRHSFARWMGLTGAAVAAAIASAGAARANEYLMQYFERSDTITVAPGDATDTNKAVQAITRWPRASREDHWLSDGEVARRATVRYRTNKVTPPKTLSGKSGEGNDLPQTADTPEPSEGAKARE